MDISNILMSYRGRHSKRFIQRLGSRPKQSKDTKYCEYPIMDGQFGFQIASGIKGARNDKEDQRLIFDL